MDILVQIFAYTRNRTQATSVFVVKEHLERAAATLHLQVGRRGGVVQEGVLSEGDGRAVSGWIIVQVRQLQHVVQRAHKGQLHAHRARRPAPLQGRPVVGLAQHLRNIPRTLQIPV